MAQQQFANSEVFLRQMVETEVPQQYQDEALFLHQFVEKKPGQWVNQKGLQITSDFAPDSSVNNISAGGAFPAGGINTYANMYVGYVRQVGTIEFDWDTYNDMSKGKESALVSVADKIKRVNSAQFREMEEQCWQDGTGVKAVVASASSATYTLTTTETTAAFTSKGAQFLYKNRSYDRYSSSGTLLDANNLCIGPIAKQGTSPTAVFANTIAGSVSAGDILVHAGSYNKAARGIPYLLGNGSGLKQGLLQSSYPELKSPLEDLNGAVLQPSTIYRLLNKIKYRRGVQAGGGRMIVGSVAMIEAYNRSGFNFIRINSGDTYDGIVNKSTIAGDKAMEVTTCDEGTLTVFDPSTIFRIEKMPYGFFREDGNTFRQKQGSNGAGAMAIYANVGVEWNLYSTVPGAGGRIIRGSVSGLSTEATSWAA